MRHRLSAITASKVRINLFPPSQPTISFFGFCDLSSLSWRCISNACQDTILYMASGTGILLVSPGAGQDVKRHELSSGDFAFIPSWTEHQLLNESDQDTVWVFTRSGSQPVTVGLTDWGGDQAK